ncbi:MAG: hypothetical protein AAB692_01860 [Patescibacteria group bacterium]
MKNKRETMPITAGIIMLALLASAFLCNDIWKLATETMDFNRHLPFFIPVVLGAFIAMLVVIKRHSERLPPTDRRDGK